MRPLGFLLASLAFALGCGGTTKEPTASAGAGQSSAGTGGSAEPVAGAGGSAEPGGAGGSVNAGAPSGGSAEGGSAAGGTEGGASSLVDCDTRNVRCKLAMPVCGGTFQVPSVEGNCYGECVKIERCACSGPEQCPDNAQFTCWSKTHCGPYVH